MKSSIVVFVALLIQEAFSNVSNPGLLHRPKRQMDFLKNFPLFGMSNPTFNCQGNANCGNNIGNTVTNNNHNEFINGNKVEMSGGTVHGGISIGGSNPGIGSSNSNARGGKGSSVLSLYFFGITF